MKAAALILFLGLYAFWPALSGDWLWDDDLYITENPVLREPGAMAKIWLHPAGVNYFPVTQSVQWGQWQLWHDRPLGYHLTNLALHLGSAFLVWRLLRKLGLTQAWAGGVLFAVHPMTVESVAWVSEIKNTVSLVPLLLAACAWVDFSAENESRPEGGRRPPGGGSLDPSLRRPEVGGHLGGRLAYGLALFWFLVAMLCKSTVAMFPVMLLAYAWWKRGRLRWRDAAACVPFFLISGGLSLVTVWFEHHRAMGISVLPPGHETARFAAAGMSAAFYLAKGLLPVGLAPIYPQWSVDPPAWVQFLPWAVFAASLAWLLNRRPRFGAGLGLGLAWFWGNLFPVLGWVPMSYQLFSWVADHFAYISLVGLAGIAAAGLETRWPPTSGRRRLGPNDPPPGGRRPPRLRLNYSLGVVALAALLAVESHGLAGHYRNGLSLWSEALRRNPNAAAAHDNFGAALAKSGQFDRAIREYEAALRLRPAYADAEYNLGIALAKTGRGEEAIVHYERALQIQPQHPKAANNLGSLLTERGRLPEAMAALERALQLQPNFPAALNNLGIALMDEHRLPEAMARFRAALRLDPDFAEAHNNLGNALERSGRPADALAEYRTTLRIQPNFAEALFNLGNALSDLGRPAEAIAAYEEALRRGPERAAYQVNLGDLLSSAGRSAEAIVHLRRAVALDPKLEPAHFDLANELFNSGQAAEAVGEYEAAVRLMPDRPEIRNNLGSALLESGRPREAIAQYREALRLAPDYADALANLRRAERRLGAGPAP